MHRQIAGKLTSKTTKWVMLVVWIVVLVASDACAQAHRRPVERAISWLPADAESTKASRNEGQFQSENTIPAVVVYEEQAGLTEDELAKVQADADEIATFEDRDGEVIGPIPSEDGQAVQTTFPRHGQERLGEGLDVVKDMRDIAKDGGDGMTVYITGPLRRRQPTPPKRSKGIDGKLLFAACCRHRDPAVHLSQPCPLVVPAALCWQSLLSSVRRP